MGRFGPVILGKVEVLFKICVMKWPSLIFDHVITGSKGVGKNVAKFYCRKVMLQNFKSHSLLSF
jgi:hypothetical protein